MFDTEAYLRAIGFSGPVYTEPKTLRKLHRVHMMAIPYNNARMVDQGAVDHGSVDHSAVDRGTVNRGAPVPADEQCSPSAACCAHSLRNPFSVSPEIGIIGCLASSSARTVPVEPPWT